MRLPLNIFEDRYKLMLKHCLEHSQPFGVVLIEHGDEVGGPAVPTMVGTLAHILSVEETEDGRYLIETEGRERIRIEEQLRRYPYIQAEVLEYPSEVSAADQRLGAEVRPLFEEFCKTALAMTGQWVKSLPLPEDPARLAEYVAPRLSANNVSKQRILEAPTISAQLEMERDLLGVETRALVARLRTLQTQRWWGLAASN
jgi:uncharacterized protein